MRFFKTIVLSLIFTVELFSIDFGFEVVSGEYTPNEEQNISNATMFGIRNNFYIFKDVALSIKYDLVNNKKVENTHRYTFALKYQVTDLDARFQPFFDLGVGQELGFKQRKYIQTTLGTKYFLTREFNILGEANYIKKRNTSQSYFFALGLGFDFFRKPSTSIYTEKPLDETTMKQLASHKISTKEDIFLSPY